MTPLPQGVVPAGHPQIPCDADWHAMPEVQHLSPQGVVPLGQQQEVAAFVHVPPEGQHPCPHTEVPAGQLTALPRKGRSKTAPTAAAAPPPRTLRARRREVGSAIARDRSSKPSIGTPPAVTDGLLRGRSPINEAHHGPRRVRRRACWAPSDGAVQGQSAFEGQKLASWSVTRAPVLSL